MDPAQTHFGSPYEEVVEKPAAKSAPAIPPEKEEEEIDLTTFLVRHVEVNYLRLIYTWPYRATYIEKGRLWRESGTLIDLEYSYLGEVNVNFYKYLKNYELWDEVTHTEQYWLKHCKNSGAVLEYRIEGDGNWDDSNIEDEKPNYAAPESIEDILESERTPLMWTLAESSNDSCCGACRYWDTTRSGYAQHCLCPRSPIYLQTINIDDPWSLAPCEFFEKRVWEGEE